MPEALEPWPNWHCIDIRDAPDGFLVCCIPHGVIAWGETYLEAFEAALQHDHDNGTCNP